MADVEIIPKISCDNCGATVEKTGHKDYSGGGMASVKYSKPKDWGSCRIEGTRDADAYGNKERLDFTDLCPLCATAILKAAALAAKDRRAE